jgi:type I restriction enzyme R subunit
MNKKSLSERDICTKFITPSLVAAGWDLDTQIREEVGFTDGRIYVRGKIHARAAKKRVDHILYYKPNIPLAIIEAKDNNHTGVATWIHMALTTDKGPRGTLLGYSRGDKPDLNLPNIRSVPIPLPPLAGQAAIVERVEALMTTCRLLETEIAAHLLQAVLKEAFAPSVEMAA